MKHTRTTLSDMLSCGPLPSSTRDISEVDSTISDYIMRQQRHHQQTKSAASSLLSSQQTRKRKNTLVIPKKSSDGQFIKVVWTKLMKKNYMSSENPLELFDKLGNNRYFSLKTLPSSSSVHHSQVVTNIPVRHLTGRNSSTKKVVGLKVYGLYTGDQCSICENECRILSVISSFDTSTKKLNIIQYEKSHYIGNSIWIETEPYYCSLATVIEKMTMSEEVIATIAKDLLEAICFLHKQGIVHRDIRPSNILVCKKETNSLTFKLANFHSGYQLQPQDNGRIRDMASLMITEIDAIQYLAPEMIATQEGDEETIVEYDMKCDIWSFGLTMLSLVTRTCPFPQKNISPEEILSKLISSDFQPSTSTASNSHCSLLLDDFIRKCCCRDVNRRWSSEELLSHDFLTKNVRVELDGLIKSCLN